MKNLLILLLIATSTLAQTTNTLHGATLSYDKKTKKMTLNMTEKTFAYPDNSDYDTEIRITRDYDISLTINGVDYGSMVEPCFYMNGYKHPMFSAHWIEKKKSLPCITIKDDYIFQFPKPSPGEYVITINKRCDEKYIEETWTDSIIIE